MTNTKQLSRVAGVPRLKLPIWKAAAAQFFAGKEPSRTDQQNKGHRTKVSLLRELVASDPKIKSWLIQFATEQRGKDARQMAAEQGLSMPDVLGGPSMSEIDQMVACLEAGKKLEDNFTAEQLSGPGDPKWAAFTEWLDTPKPPVVMGCTYCGFRNGPATRTTTTAEGRVDHWCAQDHRPANFVPAPEYTFGNQPTEPAPSPNPSPVHDPTGRAAALRALGEAIEDGNRLRPTGRADFGPTVPPEPKEL